MDYTVALFGEAERGEFQRGYYCKSLAELSDCLGEPPSEQCRGLHFAIQTLLFDREVLYFRVHEEGFSMQDYMKGLYVLEKEGFPRLAALCLPGVGDQEIIEATLPIVETHKSCLILTERDLYDYLTCR